MIPQSFRAIAEDDIPDALAGAEHGACVAP